MVEKDRGVRSKPGNLLAQHIERELVVTWPDVPAAPVLRASEAPSAGSGLASPHDQWRVEIDPVQDDLGVRRDVDPGTLLAGGCLEDVAGSPCSSPR